jgi:hypothetical protein
MLAWESSWFSVDASARIALVGLAATRGDTSASVQNSSTCGRPSFLESPSPWNGRRRKR